MVELKNEAYRLISKRGERRIVLLEDILPIIVHGSAVGPVECSQKVQQRALSCTALTHDGYDFAMLHGE